MVATGVVAGEGVAGAGLVLAFSLLFIQSYKPDLQSRGDRANGTSAEGTYEEGPVPAANILPLAEPSDAWDGTPTTEASGAPTGPAGEGDAPGGFRARRRRGPPENGVPSATKVMVANLPYELSEEKVSPLEKTLLKHVQIVLTLFDI